MFRRFIIVFVIILIAGVSAMYGLRRQHNANAAPENHASGMTKSTESFEKKKYSLTAPASIWVVVNKKRPLQPQNYVPEDLVTPDLPLRVPGNESMQMRKVTAEALTKMFEAAKADDARMMVSSAYRSYAYQVSLYGKYVSDQGRATADLQSARPGYSEHQTGLAVDIEPYDQQCDVDQCFADLPAGKWVVANAYEYGFIIRYPNDKTKITGYEYEPWHLRFVGVELATEMHNQHIGTLEEFFGLPAASDY
jgi:D-alanyl-D-alanine carboxypeptidase